MTHGTDKNMQKSDKVKETTVYLGFLAVSITFMLIFSLWTSPVYKHWYGCDASFFTLVGRGMLDGRIPYRDFYDLKGPYFFFIQALGQLIYRGRTGIFILQTVALFLSLIFIYGIGLMFLSRGKALGVTAFFLWPYISMIWGGNCLEEFCLPLNMLAILLNLKLFAPVPADIPDNTNDVMAEDQSIGNNITALITGICFGIMTFSKITAGAPLAGLIIGIFILCLVRRKFKPLIFYMIYFILGFLISVLPLLIYFGYYNSILKMLYCTFIFGFKRSSDLSKVLSFDLEVKLSGVIFSIIFILLHTFSRRSKSSTDDVCSDDTSEHTISDSKDMPVIPADLSILLLPTCLVTYLALHLGDSFIYYFITGMPCLIVTIILFVKLYDPLILFKTLKQSLCWLLLFVFVFHYTKDSLGTIDAFIHRKDDTFHEGYYTNAMNMGTLIPEYDRGSVFSFDIDMQWYEINNIMPCNRYVINLQYFIALEPPIEQELFDFLNLTPPKWMICSNTLADYLPQMNEIIQANYDCIYSTDIGSVYLLRK